MYATDAAFPAPSADRMESEDLQRYARGMALLLDAVQQLSLARDLGEVQRIVRGAARALVGSDGATFVLNEGGTHCRYADEDAIAPLWKGRSFPQESCISGWVMRHREAAVIPDIYADPRIPYEAYRPTFVKSLAMVPIRARDPVGAIGSYWASTHVPSVIDLQLLQALADSTSVAMENVRVYEELEQRVRARTAELIAANEAIRTLLVTDDLTGLLNRRGFQDRCQQALPGAARVVLAYMDVDGLKLANDRRGHGAGDAMLVDVAAMLRDSFDAADILARVGGDEFCVVALDPPFGPDEVRRRVTEGLGALNRAEGRAEPLSVSLGVVELAGGCLDALRHAQRHAEERMYTEKRDKRAGR